MTHALVTSRFNYGNALEVGLPLKTAQENVKWYKMWHPIGFTGIAVTLRLFPCATQGAH